MEQDNGPLVAFEAFDAAAIAAPGMTAMAAAAREDGRVVGFVQVFADAFERVGAAHLDLVVSDESFAFYRSRRHREQVGFRVYSDRGTD